MRKQEIVPVKDTGSVTEGHDGRLYPRKGDSVVQAHCNFDIKTERGRALLLACGNPGDIEFGPDGVVDVRVRWFCIFADEGVNPETGEISTFARTCLLTDDGQIFRTTSAHAPHRIQATLELFSAAEWEQGIRVRIRQRVGKLKRIYHDIRLHPDYLKEGR